MNKEDKDSWNAMDTLCIINIWYYTWADQIIIDKSSPDRNNNKIYVKNTRQFTWFSIYVKNVYIVN